MANRLIAESRMSLLLLLCGLESEKFGNRFSEQILSKSDTIRWVYHQLLWLPKPPQFWFHRFSTNTYISARPRSQRPTDLFSDWRVFSPQFLVIRVPFLPNALPRSDTLPWTLMFALGFFKDRSPILKPHAGQTSRVEFILPSCICPVCECLTETGYVCLTFILLATES